MQSKLKSMFCYKIPCVLSWPSGFFQRRPWVCLQLCPHRVFHLCIDDTLQTTRKGEAFSGTPASYCCTTQLWPEWQSVSIIPNWLISMFACSQWVNPYCQQRRELSVTEQRKHWSNPSSSHLQEHKAAIVAFGSRLPKSTRSSLTECSLRADKTEAEMSWGLPEEKNLKLKTFF